MRPVISLLALLLAACPGGPEIQAPPEIDISAALRFEEEGKKADALLEHARLIRELNASGRSDARFHAAWARILGSLRRIKVRETLAGASPAVQQRCEELKRWCSPEGPAFLGAGAASHWTQVLALGAEPPILAEGAGAIADLLAEKLEDKTARRGRIEPEGELSERLYRRYLAQAASEFARYAVNRGGTRESAARAIRLLRRLAREIRELAGLSGVLEGPAARWAELADQADAAAIALRPSRGGDPAFSNTLRQEVEADSAGLLNAAIENLNKANDLLSRRADESEILDSLERALRHFVTARECILEPSPNQKRTLDVMSIAADALRHQAFKN
jgi:hypothetical protein